MLLHVSLPMIMERIRPRSSFKQLLHAWIDVVAAWLGMPSELYEKRNQIREIKYAERALSKGRYNMPKELYEK